MNPSKKRSALLSTALMMLASGNPHLIETGSKIINKPRRRVKLMPSDPVKREIAEWNAAIDAKKAAKKARKQS
jgi:hypothetical protein